MDAHSSSSRESYLMARTAFATVPLAPISQFLEGIPAPELKVILAEAKFRRFPARSVVARQGDPAERLFLIVEGRARYFYNCEHGPKLLLFWLTPGDIFGATSVLTDPLNYLVSTETVKETSLLVWDRATIRRLAAVYPRLLENALGFASNYLIWYVGTHVALASHTARQRLARVLVCLAESIGQKIPEGFQFDATNEELAGAANITVFTASRLLNEWQRDRALMKRRGKILLLSPQKLSFRGT
jgi:CRP-like cAMP-binding protein